MSNTTNKKKRATPNGAACLFCLSGKFRNCRMGRCFTLFIMGVHLFKVPILLNYISVSMQIQEQAQPPLCL